MGYLDHDGHGYYTNKLPDILSQHEVSRIIGATSNIKHRAMLMLAYGALPLN